MALARVRRRRPHRACDRSTDMNPFNLWLGRSRPDPLKGLAAGAAGGLAGAVAASLFQGVWTAARRGALPGQRARGEIVSDWDRRSDNDRGGPSHPATERAAVAVSRRVLHRDLDETQRRVAGHAVHAGFGTTVGALYGLAAEYHPGVALGGGVPLGIGLALAADEAAAPALGLIQPPNRRPLSAHLRSLGSHLVFAAVCEATRSAVRRGWR